MRGSRQSDGKAGLHLPLPSLSPASNCPGLGDAYLSRSTNDSAARRKSDDLCFCSIGLIGVHHD